MQKKNCQSDRVNQVMNAPEEAKMLAFGEAMCRIFLRMHRLAGRGRNDPK